MSIDLLKNSLKEIVKRRFLHLLLTDKSTNGMSRKFRIFIAEREDDVVEITHTVANVMGYKLSPKGVLVKGCGMDMSFALVYDLYRVLGLDTSSLKYRVL